MQGVTEKKQGIKGCIESGMIPIRFHKYCTGIGVAKFLSQGQTKRARACFSCLFMITVVASAILGGRGIGILSSYITVPLSQRR